VIAELDPAYLRASPTKAVSRLVSYALFEGRPLTTRGRWINPLVFGLYRLARRLPQLSRVTAPIFIIGSGRSGTTALGVVLSMHPAVGFLNEPKALWHVVYPGEDVLGNYSRGPARFRLDADDATAEAKAAAHKLYGAYLAATASARVVDKYPELVFRVPFVRALFPDAKFLFLIRNGWDTCASIARQSQVTGARSRGEQADWWGVGDRKWTLLVDQLVTADSALHDRADEIRAFQSERARAAVEWVVTMNEGIRVREALPAAVFTLRFEDLIAGPESVLREVLAFCGLPPDRRCLDYGRSVLTSRQPARKFEMHPSIAPLFRETMASLGYA
jgi:hypothetical protein